MYKIYLQGAVLYTERFQFYILLTRIGHIKNDQDLESNHIASVLHPAKKSETDAKRLNLPNAPQKLLRLTSHDCRIGNYLKTMFNLKTNVILVN